MLLETGVWSVEWAGLADWRADDIGTRARGLTLLTSSDHGCVQVHRRALQEEAVGRPPIPAPRSVRCIICWYLGNITLKRAQVLGVPPVERHPPRFAPLPP